MTVELVFEGIVLAGETRDIEPSAIENGSVSLQPLVFNALLVETDESFEVCDLVVNGDGQFANPTPIPAGAFKNTHDIRLALDPIEKGTRVALQVRNVGTESRPFRAKLQALPNLPKPTDPYPRELPLGFHGMVQPGETTVSSAPTNVDFAPERLIVPSRIASHFRIVNVLSDGKGSMPEPIEASLVTEQHNQAALSDPKGHPWPRRVCEGLPVCKKDRRMTLVVMNTSASPQEFLAAVIGSATSLD
jgi:hypothetical protein